MSGSARRSILDPCNYDSAHRRCREMWGRASQYSCIRCGAQALDWAYDGSDSTQLGSGKFHSRFPEFYMPLCRSCHQRLDTPKGDRIALLGVRISATTKARLENAARKLAVERGLRVSMASLVDEILTEWLTREGM